VKGKKEQISIFAPGLASEDMVPNGHQTSLGGDIEAPTAASEEEVAAVTAAAEADLDNPSRYRLKLLASEGWGVTGATTEGSDEVEALGLENRAGACADGGVQSQLGGCSGNMLQYPALQRASSLPVTNLELAPPPPQPWDA
ncbi:unnamed protein product, partial [Discosporangium mesarthrocarpum]